MALLLIPLVEIVLIVLVTRLIGGWWTFGLLLAFTAAGALLVRREGRRTWGALRTALRSGRMPGREMADAALVFVGGLLMLTPGFLTDAIGLFLVLPVSRALSRRLLTAVVGSRLLGGVFVRPGAAGAPYDGAGDGRSRGGYGATPGSGQPPRPPRPGSRDDVIEGEIIREDPPPTP